MAERAANHIDRMFELGWPVEHAIRMAAIEAVMEHRRARRPIVSWRDGKVVELWGEEIERAVAEGLAKNPPWRSPPPVDPVLAKRQRRGKRPA